MKSTVVVAATAGANLLALATVADRAAVALAATLANSNFGWSGAVSLTRASSLRTNYYWYFLSIHEAPLDLGTLRLSLIYCELRFHVNLTRSPAHLDYCSYHTLG